MGQVCCVCKFSTIFYIWSSTRNFPIHKLENILDDDNIKDEGKPVCFKCCKKIGYL